MKSIEPVVEEVKEKALRTCDALEVATSTVSSLPHFMAGGFNRVTVEGINFTIQGFAKTLDVLIIAVEGIIVWLIHTFQFTYRCLLSFAFRGSTTVLSESVRVLGDFLNGKLGEIKTKLDGDINGINSSLDQIFELEGKQLCQKPTEAIWCVGVVAI